MKNNLNLLLAAIFMMGFLMFWDKVVMSRYGAPSSKPVAGSKATALSEPGKLSPAELKPLVAGKNPEQETLTVLESADTKISVLSKGARIASWQVKERDHWIELVVPEQKRVVSPLETYGDINFAANKMSDQAASFSAVLPSGVQFTKQLELLGEPPFHRVTLTAKNPTQTDVTLNTALPLGNGVDKHVVGRVYDVKDENGAMAENRSMGLAAQVKSWRPGFIFGRTVDLMDPTPFKWVGVDNNHFMTVLLPSGTNDIPGAKVVADRKHPPMIAVPLNTTLKPNDEWTQSFLLYGGPKDYDDLKKVGHNLDQAVNFGFFGVISKILLRTLIFFDSITHNYGWAIILLTFAIQLLVFPLTRKNLQHSVRMRELQPQIKKLQEQFKSDPKRLQVETFNFYKRNGMRFMGMEGCFPMLLQLPVFFAFYSTLRVAYELRGAPWIFWIHDLGAHDPYYVLPIIMGAGMFLQQKLTAVAADPAQARMMMFMPIMFTFMFLKLPAGLVLYWCVNSMTTIIIQKFIGHKNTPALSAT